jgi:hypothetical protein
MKTHFLAILAVAVVTGIPPTHAIEPTEAAGSKKGGARMTIRDLANSAYDSGV